MLGRYDHLVMQNLWVLDDVLDLVDWCSQYVGGNQLLDQFVACEFARTFGDHLIKHIFIGQACIDIVKTLVLVPLSTQRTTDIAEEFFARRGDDDILAILGWIDTGGCKIKTAIAGTRRTFAGCQIAADGAGLGMFFKQKTAYEIITSTAGKPVRTGAPFGSPFSVNTPV